MLSRIRIKLVNKLIHRTIYPVFAIHDPDSSKLIQARAYFDRIVLLTPFWHHCTIHSVSTPVSGEWIIPPYYTQRIVLYIHGGAFYLGSPRSHRQITTHLAELGASRVLSLDYRRAPEHPITAATEDAVTAYQYLLQEGYAPHQIVIAGDSAGGNIGLATLLQLKKLHLPQPAAALLLSPWADLSGSMPSYTRLSDSEVMLDAHCLRQLGVFLSQGLDIDDPALSPIHGDFTGLPPLLFQVSDCEILLDDSLNCATKSREQGVKTELKIWSNMPHVFQLFSMVLPEARLALADLVRFMDIHCTVSS